MILFHGSNCEVATPDVLHSRSRVDFGKGFYTTPLYEQARKWCERYKRIGETGIISRYFCDEIAFEGLMVLRFDSYSEEWLDFITSCRTGRDSSNYDIVIGGVANDRVFDTIELYFDGLIDKREAIKRLYYQRPNFQVCFRTQKAINQCLRYEGSECL